MYIVMGVAKRDISPWFVDQHHKGNPPRRMDDRDVPNIQVCLLTQIGFRATEKSEKRKRVAVVMSMFFIRLEIALWILPTYKYKFTVNN